MKERLSDGERLIVSMLCDLYEHLGIYRSSFDTDFARAAVSSGQDWAILEKYEDQFPDQPASGAVAETYEILEMWSDIQRNFAKLNAEERMRVLKATEMTEDALQFPGFASIAESDYCDIARWAIEMLKAFDVKARNSHVHSDSGMFTEMLEIYRRMLDKMRWLDDNYEGKQHWGAQWLIELLNSRKQPGSQPD